MSILTDSISFSDQVLFTIGSLQRQATVSDCLAFLDGLTFLIDGRSGGTSDNLSFSDAVLSSLTTPKSNTLNDNFFFSDSLAASLNQAPTIAEAVAFVDALIFFLAIIITASDSIAFTDAVQINLMVEIRVTCTDSLTLTDTLGSLVSQTDYLRRYLNDKS